jgi:hypothetical protein
LKFVAELEPPLLINEGWLIIKGTSNDSCWFLWQDALEGNAVIYDAIEDSWYRADDLGLAFCIEVDTTVGITDDQSHVPSAFELSQNYPNPFNAKTSIKYNLPRESNVTIEVYDIQGRKIETLISEKQAAGYYTVIWNAEDVSSGMYFYKIRTDEFEETQKMLLLK